MEQARHRSWSGTFDYYTHMPSRGVRESLLHPLETGLYPMNPGHTTERNTYPSFLLMHLDGGAMDVTTEAFRGTARDGDLILLDCHAYHRYVATEATDVLWLHFDGPAARYLYRTIVDRLGVIVTLPDPEPVLAPMRAIYDMFRSGEGIDEILAARHLADMLAELALSGPSTGSRSAAMQRVMAYVSSHLAEPLDVRTLAGMAGLGERSFTRAFKQESGYTPHAYVVMARMGRAKRMLASSSAGLQEICDVCGYSQPAVFCSAFKASTGLSPMEYRQVMMR